MSLIIDSFRFVSAGGGPTDTGWLTAGTITDNGDEVNPWSNLSNALVDNTAVASCMNIGARDYTNTLNCTNFGAVVPGGATINGVEFRQKTRANNSNDMVRDATFILKAGTKSGTGDGVSFAGLTNILTTYDSGSSSSMHGTTLTPSDVNHTGFGMWLRWADDGAGSGDDTYLAVAQLKIHYTT